MPRITLRDMARTTFAFLTTDFGFDEPEEATDDPQDTVFRRGPLSYRFGLSSGRDLLFRATARLTTPTTLLIAGVPRLVFEAGLGPLNAVSVHARSGHSLDKSLESHAHYLRLLTPLLADPTRTINLMRAADAREFTRE